MPDDSNIILSGHAAHKAAFHASDNEGKRRYLQDHVDRGISAVTTGRLLGMTRSGVMFWRRQLKVAGPAKPAKGVQPGCAPWSGVRSVERQPWPADVRFDDPITDDDRGRLPMLPAPSLQPQASS